MKKYIIALLIFMMPLLAFASPYALVDGSGNVENIVEWNGSSSWSAPAGYSAIPATTGAMIGGTYNSSTGVFTPKPSPAPTPTQMAQAAILNGVVVTSTSTPALNGTYAVDPTTQGNIDAVITYIVINGTFPGGATTMPWYDTSGVAHTIPSIAEFKLFATALANYVTSVTLYAQSGGQGSLPSNQITIP